MRGPYQKKNLAEATLVGIAFFGGLEESKLREILRYCEGREYPPRGVIIDQAQPTQDVFFIVSGSVDAMLTTDEAPFSFQVLRRGSMFGELAALDQGPRTTHVLARENTFVIRMPGVAFRNIIFEDKRLGERTMLRICALSRYLCQLTYAVLRYDVRRRVLFVFYHELVANNPSELSMLIKPAPSQRELGERCGTNRSQVTRTLKELKDLELLETGHQTWRIPDPKKLLEYLQSVLDLPADSVE